MCQGDQVPGGPSAAFEYEQAGLSRGTLNIYSGISYEFSLGKTSPAKFKLVLSLSLKFGVRSDQRKHSF